ncbi:MAG TPA: hypothetical protein PK002_05515, partial [Cellvibrio sp.]|nr:hypothetical protein [Cellvibrio sp.]
MQTKTTFKFLGATLMSLMLAACGGGGGSSLDNGGGGGGGLNSSSVAAKNWRIGTGSGSAFISGAIATSISGTLFEGDTTQLSISVVDDQGNLTSDIKQVAFDSPCIAAG